MADLISASNAFKAFTDITRIRICRLLMANQTPMCVCELVDSLEEQQYNVSKQVKILETAGILTKEKEGRWIYYSLNQDDEAFLDALFESIALIEDINEQLAGDQRRFEARMKLREDGRCKVGILQKELTSS